MGKETGLVSVLCFPMSLLGRKSVISSDYQFPLPALGL